MLVLQLKLWARIHCCSLQVELDFQNLILCTDDGPSKLVERLLVLLEFGGVLHSAVLRQLLNLQRVVVVLQGAQVVVQSADLRAAHHSEFQRVRLIFSEISCPLHFIRRYKKFKINIY